MKRFDVSAFSTKIKLLDYYLEYAVQEICLIEAGGKAMNIDCGAQFYDQPYQLERGVQRHVYQSSIRLNNPDLIGVVKAR